MHLPWDSSAEAHFTSHPHSAAFPDDVSTARSSAQVLSRGTRRQRPLHSCLVRMTLQSIVIRNISFFQNSYLTFCNTLLHSALMKRTSKIYLALPCLAIVLFLITIGTKRNDNEIVDKLLFEPRVELKDFGQSITGRNEFYNKLDILIEKDSFKQALNILDTARIYEPLKLGYMGLINLKLKKYRESINYFTEAFDLEGTGFSKFIAYRAYAYIKLNLVDSALEDYRYLASFNCDFYKPLAETYEGINRKDSAIKYYQLFLQHYPDSLSIGKKLAELKNGSLRK